MRVTKTSGIARHDGSLESEDDLDTLRLPFSILSRTFQMGLWQDINAQCGTMLDEYEGFWIESATSRVAANLIRQSLDQDRGAPEDYVNCLNEAAKLLENCAIRGVRVMISL